MQEVKKLHADELLSLRREWWERASAGLSPETRMKITCKAMNVEREMQNSASTKFNFDDLANLVARENLSDECYYNLLRDCGFEVT